MSYYRGRTTARQDVARGQGLQFPTVERESFESTMKSYVILLRPLLGRRGRDIQRVSLEPSMLRELGRSIGVQLLDVLDCRVSDVLDYRGICDVVLLCRAAENSAVSRLLETLEGWQNEVLSVSCHARYDE